MAAFGSKSTDPNEDEQSKEFAQSSLSAPRRLNDIAQRPPEMKEMPWSVKCVNLGAQREKILSMAQRTMMERELERAIARYYVKLRVYQLQGIDKQIEVDVLTERILHHCPRRDLNLPRPQALIYSWIFRGIDSLFTL